MRVLVTGGAGYIGSHTVKLLAEAKFDVVVYDNLVRGHREAIRGFHLVEGDTADTEKVSRLLLQNRINAVMHFAAYSLVGESVEQPVLYYNNNVTGGLSLLEAVVKSGVKYFIFSSSAAVYGEPSKIPIRESQVLNPNNPYGETKAVIEKALAYYEKAYGLKSVSLRYFNAAGASPGGEIGEDHSPETHLVPLVLQAAFGQREKIIVFGDDYPTADGSAVRDYIHVDDLARAHIMALEALANGSPSSPAYNLGNGSGYSVLEVIKAAETVTGIPVPYEIGPRRQGDPAVLVASSELIKCELGWIPHYASLESIIKTAWKWHREHPDGYCSCQQEK